MSSVSSTTPVGLPPDSSSQVQGVLQALTFQHNEAAVAQEATADLDDSPTIAWTLTDDPANGRMKLSAAATGNVVTTAFGRHGPTIVAQSGDYAAAQVTNAADKSSAAAQVFSGALSTPQLSVGGAVLTPFGSGSAGAVLSSTVAGNFYWVVGGPSNTRGILDTDAANGLNITDGPTKLIGFYGAAPVAQQTAISPAGFTQGAGTTVNNNSLFTGAVGATQYTIGDLVRVMKLLGLIRS
jgi:hypothetical protein